MYFSISNLRMSLLKILICLIFEYFSLRCFAKLLSFSIRIKLFGLHLSISFVNAPFPGPISTISLFFNSNELTIFFIMFLLNRKFWQRDFF